MLHTELIIGSADEIFDLEKNIGFADRISKRSYIYGVKNKWPVLWLRPFQPSAKLDNRPNA